MSNGRDNHVDVLAMKILSSTSNSCHRHSPSPISNFKWIQQPIRTTSKKLPVLFGSGLGSLAQYVESIVTIIELSTPLNVWTSPDSGEPSCPA